MENGAKMSGNQITIQLCILILNVSPSGLLGFHTGVNHRRYYRLFITVKTVTQSYSTM